MTINELRGIIMEHGHEWQWIGGCRLLEHIVDVEGFVSLLREFKNKSIKFQLESKKFVDVVGVSFVDDNPDPIGTILNGGVVFGVDNDTSVYIGAKSVDYIGFNTKHYFYRWRGVS
jgi:hypothetical protein